VSQLKFFLSRLASHFRRLARGRAALHAGRQPNGERRAVIRRAFDADIAAHHLAEFACDGQPQAGAAKLSGGRSIRLRARLSSKSTHDFSLILERPLPGGRGLFA
jgi:hypothetical protein